MISQPEVIHDPAQIDFERPGKHHYQVAFHLDSNWGYSLVPLTVINGTAGNASGPPGVAVFGGTHGNEYEGQVAIKWLCLDLDPARMRGRLMLIPQLSESACRAHMRCSPEDGVNMNRAFPGNAKGTLSYRISHFVKTRIFPQARIVIDIHSGGKEAVFPLCTSFHPLSNREQHAETAAVAQLFNTPFIFIYSRQMASGLLVDEAEDEGKITIGGEFGHAEAASLKGIDHAYHGIQNVLKYYGLLEGEITRAASPSRIVQAADLKDYIPAPGDGIWEPAVEPGAEVRKDDLIGRLHNFEDHASPPCEIRAHKSGIVIAMYFAAVCKKGLTLYVIGEQVIA